MTRFALISMTLSLMLLVGAFTAFGGASTAFGQATSSVLLVHSQTDDRCIGKVWSVDASVDSKDAARVVLEFSPETVGPGAQADSVLASTLPHPAPNGSMIGYIEGDDMWILDVSTGQSRRLTDVNANCREGELIAQARLTAWSHDSTQLLCAITRTDGPDPFAQYERCRASYGFYRFKTQTETIERVEFLNADDWDPNIEYRAFFGNERFRVSRRREAVGGLPEMLRIFVVDGDDSNRVDTIQSSMEWVDLSADGGDAACWSLTAGPDTPPQILKLDLSTGISEAVSSNTDRFLGRSKLSPSGRRTAYEQPVSIDVKTPAHEVLIDKQAILAGVGLDIEWFDDDRIAVLLREETDDGIVEST